MTPIRYNFDEIISRRETNSYKWDSAADAGVLPMWVADMDFRTPPCIVKALQERVSHGIFGYTRVPEEYYSSVISWFARRHGWHIGRDWLIYTSGVVPAISAVIKALTVPGDKVLLLAPVYNCFFSSIRNNGCHVVASPLLYDGVAFTIDYEDLERKAADPAVKVMLLCNPHNPVGRVWSIDELKRIGEICLEHNVVVVSDEIHCELVYPGHAYTPFASVSTDFQASSVTCISPSKSFNMAGLQIANIVCPDDVARRKIDKAININEVCDVNPFGVVATIAAYNEGEEWLGQLLDYLLGNYHAMCDFCKTYLPDFPLASLEGTYLVWMDCRSMHEPSEAIESRLLDKAKLWLNAGSMYGMEGDGFMRWNIACPRSLLMEGLNRFKSFVDSL